MRSFRRVQWVFAAGLLAAAGTSQVHADTYGAVPASTHLSSPQPAMPPYSFAVPLTSWPRGDAVGKQGVGAVFSSQTPSLSDLALSDLSRSGLAVSGEGSSDDWRAEQRELDALDRSAFSSLLSEPAADLLRAQQRRQAENTVLMFVATATAAGTDVDPAALVDAWRPLPPRLRDVIFAAVSQSGKRYVAYAVGPDAFDCSGLTMFAFRFGGVSLPHYSNAQRRAAENIDVADLHPGDLVFPVGGGHVAMYVGAGLIVHASSPARGVLVEGIDLTGRHWRFGRVELPSLPALELVPDLTVLPDGGIR